MPGEVILNYLANSSEWDQLCFRVVFQCALVLKGVKASNLVTLPKGMWLYLFNILKDTGISCKVLSSGRDKEVIFLYREEALMHILENEDIREFVGTFGYECMKVGNILQRLRSRYEQFAKKEAKFPHELGVFLEYPLEDVKAFISNEGKNSLLAGYWKVYYNPEKAIRLFESYDEVREYAVIEFMNNKSIRQVICERKGGS